ncbi:MAG: PilZ domain-containing protein [Pseudomonadota bacterium]|jgi:hypothetical protein|nr:PilZ domain-containing protein [Xanthomonadaceae bacterium]MDE2247445.1 PilZ domain-containing protein [Xanthomonadaceae bacterium]MDE3209285.1 PilZ domain-containing protein [Pseudomonadota bacterium]
MQDDAWLAYSERVSCEDRWPVQCEPIEWPLPAVELRRLGERNIGTLATIAALEERRSDAADENNPLMQEMMRIDAKLSALVEIVNRVLLPAQGLPPRQPVRFNVVGAVLPAALLAGATSVLLRLHPDACPTLPLEFPARVMRHLDDGAVFVVFAAMGEPECDAIERFVFRLHRRKVAETRQSAL